MAYWIIAAIIIIALLPEAAAHGLFHYIFYKPKRSTKVPKFYMDSPHYKVSRAGMAYMKTIPSEDLYMTSRDGLKLHAYFFPAEEKSDKFILGIHGYRSYARPEYGPYIKFYRDLGYNMILPDDRAHGPSEGKYIGFGVLDRLDCIDWAKYIVKNYGENVEIRLHGVSMGSATVLAASGEDDLPSQVKGIVADCGYTSAWDALESELKDMGHLPCASFLLKKCEKICQKKAGFGFHEYTPLEQVKKAKVPILFVHGGQDKMVPVRMVHELYGACGSEKRLLVVEEAGHAESIALAPERYHQAIHEFFGI